MKNLVSSSFPKYRLLLIPGVAVAFLFCQAGGRKQDAIQRVPITRPPLGTQVSINGTVVSGIESVVNEGQGTEVILMRDGNGTTRSLPGKLTLGKLILTRPWSGNMDLYNWRSAVIGGTNGMRRTVSVTYRPNTLRENQFNFPVCWPTKWVVSPFNARTNAAPTETLELIYERMEVR